MGFGLLSPRLTALPTETEVSGGLFGISQAFAWLSPARRRIIQVLLTRAPLYSYCYFLVRLACLRHAASVHSEPESNSQFKEICYVEGLFRGPYEIFKPSTCNHTTTLISQGDQRTAVQLLEIGSTENRSSKS